MERVDFQRSEEMHAFFAWRRLSCHLDFAVMGYGTSSESRRQGTPGGNHVDRDSGNSKAGRHVQDNRQRRRPTQTRRCRSRFTIAVLSVGKNGERGYQNYVLHRVLGQEYLYRNDRKKPVMAESLQPGADEGGVLSRLRAGVFTYAFKTALPAGFDRRATHVVGGEMTRDNHKYAANPAYEFIPAGGKISQRFDVVETASCNQCHDPMSAHRRAARETGYCALCHTSLLSDPETGESLDFTYLVHKIHRGKYLPSVKSGRPYYVVAAGQSVKDYSTIVSPQGVVTETIPKESRNCAACHSNPKVTAWKTQPSTTGCVSCHDDVDLKSGAKHIPGPAADGTCVNCHQPEGPEFGASVLGAHTFPGDSVQLPGTVFEILKIEGGTPGSNPVVTFSIKDKKGASVNAAQMNNLGLVLAWPTADYKMAITEDARKVHPVGGGVHTYKFNYTIPADAKGSGAVGIQGYRLFDLKRPNGTVEEKGQRDAGST